MQITVVQEQFSADQQLAEVLYGGLPQDLVRPEPLQPGVQTQIGRDRPELDGCDLRLVREGVHEGDEQTAFLRQGMSPRERAVGDEEQEHPMTKCIWHRVYCISEDQEYEIAVAVTSKPPKKCKCGNKLLVVATSTGETTRKVPTPLMVRTNWKVSCLESSF